MPAAFKLACTSLLLLSALCHEGGALSAPRQRGPAARKGTLARARARSRHAMSAPGADGGSGDRARNGAGRAVRGGGSPATRARGAGLTVAASAALGSLLHGYDTGVIAGALLFIVPEFGLEARPAVKGLIVSATTVGAIVGTLAAGPTAEATGQRRTMMLGSAVFTLGGLLLAWSPTVDMLILGRFIVGLAMGTAGAVVPVYIAECAESSARGALATVPQLFITCGIFLSYVVDLLVILFFNGSWRTMLGLSILPALLQFAALSRLPESPRWLVRRGRVDDARRALAKLRGGPAAAPAGGEAPPSAAVEEELAGIRAALEATRGAGATKQTTAAAVKALLKRGARRALAVCVVLQMFQQITGINTIIYFTPEILREAGVVRLFDRVGLSENAASMCATLLAYLPKPFAVLGASRYMDSVGRRGLLLRGLPIMGCCLALLALSYSSLPAGSVVRAAAAVLSVSLFSVAFSFSLGPVPNILSSEILPSEARSVGMSISVGTQWAFNAALVMMYPILVSAFGTQRVIVFFAAMTALAFAFVERFVPETAGKSLEEASSDAAAR